MAVNEPLVGVVAPSPPDRRIARFYLLHLALPLALAAAVLGVVYATGLDRRLSDGFYDPVSHKFPLRYDWFLEVVMHQWIKYPVMLAGMLALLGWMLSYVLPALRAQRRPLLFVFTAMALSTAATSGLRQITAKHCPWDLEIYGGFAPFSEFYQTPPKGVHPGHCFPGAHASTGFCLMAFYFLLRWNHRRRAAYTVLAGSLVLGFALGFGRVMQGTHFLSHNLWSALVCWLVILGLYELILRRKAFAAVRGNAKC